MMKEEFITRRTDIMSNMLDNPNEYGIYPTTEAFDKLDEIYDDFKEEIDYLKYKIKILEKRISNDGNNNS